MSRPPGPPPYTAEQIASLSTARERFIAQAELNSYIFGHKLADEREKAILSSPNRSKTFGTTSYNITDGYGGYANTFHNGSHDQTDRDRPQDLSAANTQNTTRGNIGPVRTRGHRARQEYGSFQPYTLSRPAHRQSQTKNYKAAVKSTVLCPDFTATGTCARNGCAKIHDTDKLALCKPFLFKHECTKGDRCHLSHHLTSNNTPHCLYYLDERCTKPSCRFIHADVDSTTSVCKSFGRTGYCEKGDKCRKLHLYECPDFANEGTCPAGDSCTLNHVRKASRMKARRSSAIATPQSSHDISDNEKITGAHNPTEGTHGISQQDDFIPFEPDD